MSQMSERDWDETDVSGEVEEARHEAFIHRCAMRDMDQGIEPNFSNDDNE
jgi:hypothetical protein